MEKFGFKNTTENPTSLIIGTLEDISRYERFSNYPLKKSNVTFLSSPHNSWIFIADEHESFHQFGSLPNLLPEGVYSIENLSPKFSIENVCRGWGFGFYNFTRYKSNARSQKSFLKADINLRAISNELSAVYVTRDLINTPPNDMGPEEFLSFAKSHMKDSGAKVSFENVEKNWPSVYAVGKGSKRQPLVLEIHYTPKDPKFSIGIAGKGICFDTGGYNLKTGSGMDLMKKDMAGAAQALALTKWIIDENLPVQIHTIMPLAENSVSGEAFRPSDVIQTKKGLTVEIGNTDAEGRIVLCDALHALSVEKPDYIFDFATLTGAARVALGPDLPALFSNSEDLAHDLIKLSHEIHDPLWHMPLWSPYKSMIQSKVADLNNATASSHAGAITAALYLQEFVDKSIPWVHIDFIGWNMSSKPGKPEGGEALGLKTIFEYVKQKAS